MDWLIFLILAWSCCLRFFAINNCFFKTLISLDYTYIFQITLSFVIPIFQMSLEPSILVLKCWRIVHNNFSTKSEAAAPNHFEWWFWPSKVIPQGFCWPSHRIACVVPLEAEAEILLAVPTAPPAPRATETCYCGTQRAIAERKGPLRNAKGYCGMQRVT